MSQQENDSEQQKTLVLNFTNGCSYDNAFQRYKSTSQYIKTITTKNVKQLYNSISNDIKDTTHKDDYAIFELVRNIKDDFGYENTMVNFGLYISINLLRISVFICSFNSKYPWSTFGTVSSL